MADLTLPALSNFYGTEHYYDIWGIRITDGIKYIMDNGYSWFVTDALAVIRYKLRDAEFLVVRLANLKNNECDLIIEDDGRVLHKQHYNYTDAEIEFKLWYVGGVLMLPSEY